MVELKKIERIKDTDNPNKLITTIKPQFNLTLENAKEADNYEHKVNNISKLKLHGNSITASSFEPQIKNKAQSDLDIKYQKNLENLVSQKENLNNSLKLEIEKKRLEVISSKLYETNERITSSHLDNVVEKNTQTVDYLLEALVKQMSKVEEEEPFLESISFLDDKPKIERVPIKASGVSHLYAKIDNIERKIENAKAIQAKTPSKPELVLTPEPKPIYAIIEEIEVPEIISIKDDTNISSVITNEFSSREQKPYSKKMRNSSFVIDEKTLKPNKQIEDAIFSKKTQKKVKTEKSPKEFKDVLMEDIIIPEPLLESPKPKAVQQKPKDPFDYILPTDYESKTETKEPELQIQPKEMGDCKTKAFKSQIPQEEYIKPKISDIDKLHISEKYNIDDFTFVNINYMMNQGLVYSIIQPELNSSQEEVYRELKKIFLDSIDSNYMSFKGDKQTINNYIQKIFDLTIDKIPYNLTDLEKKLYFNFIKRDFSGFGFLSTILEDRNIIEISCSGENMPLVVYHLKYGALETNLKFENIFKLNQYVLSLTKAMGLQVNSAQPIINGHLPNGYKVEGLYSVGDISNKGSSFIIKKYLEDPLTPVNLINLGIGANDIYSYIWTAMDEDYQIVLVGTDANILLSALSQFYPDKKITSIQTFDNLKLPQKNWIKKLLLDNIASNKKIIISQVLSQGSDYIILDNFTEDLFEIKWYDFSMLYLDQNILGKFLEKAKAISQKTIIINLERAKVNNIEQMQITNVSEMNNGQVYSIIDYSKKESEFKINLEHTNINIQEYNKHKRLLRWLVDSEITDSLDLNNIVNDYYNNKDLLFRKLNISEEF